MDGQASEGRGWWWDGLSHTKLQRLSITLWKQEKVCIVLMQKKKIPGCVWKNHQQQHND